MLILTTVVVVVVVMMMIITMMVVVVMKIMGVRTGTRGSNNACSMMLVIHWRSGSEWCVRRRGLE